MKTQVLEQHWRIRQLDRGSDLDWNEIERGFGADQASGWLAVDRMPATVHQVLISHGVIRQPWLPGEAAACRWVAEADWVYVTRFALESLDGRHYLNLGGLDTIVTVYLNGVCIGQACNMYIPLRLDVTEHVRSENTLAIRFHSVFEPGTEPAQPIRCLDGDAAKPVRRPKANYNTYLGPYPYFSRVGVFRDVVIESVGPGAIDLCVADAALSSDHQSGTVTVNVEGESIWEALLLRLTLYGPTEQPVDSVERAVACRGGRWQAEAVVQATQPELCWPRGYGAQPLYRIEISLICGDERAHTIERTVGFRRIAMSQMLHFEVNEVPVRLWGGNWVSPNWISPVWDPARSKALFELARNAHFNAFRVWGEVETPDEAFYDLADQQGFLVWQDFANLPFAPDQVSREICRREAAHTIRRLKHHPSILMWCGGNEAAMWHESEFGGPGGHWPGQEAAEIDVGQVCKQLDPDRFYLPNSPYLGIDANDPKQGDTHGYTNMWYIPGYDDLVFASEDTRISAPPLHSLRRFMAAEDLWPADHTGIYTHGDKHPWPESWMPYTTSMSWRKTGPVEQYYDATSPSEAVYRIGMAAAQYYRETIERQRRGRPSGSNSEERICGGYLAWKFNDCWPQIYSGKVDYFLEPYLVYYAIRRAYAPVLLSLDVAAYVWLWAVNDTRDEIEATARVQLYHLYENRMMREVQQQVMIGPGASQEILRLDQAGIGTFHRDHILHATLTRSDGKLIAETVALADIERAVTFPEAKLELCLDEDVLCITSDQFAHSVTLEGDHEGDPFGWYFEDNWFDLVPGQIKHVRVLGKHSTGRITARAWYSPHVATVAWSRR